MIGKIKDGFEFDAILYPRDQYKAIQIVVDRHDINKVINYINEHGIEQAEIVMPDLSFLKRCPTLKYLCVDPSYKATKTFDLTPLYEMETIKYLACTNEYGESKEFLAQLDCARLKGVEFLSVTANRGVCNIEAVESLKSLIIREYQGENKDLTHLFNSKMLDTLELNECKEESLNGIEKSEKIQCLYIHYNRFLKDISALQNVKRTIKALRIEKCPKIKDFSVLGQLTNLEYLELTGNNSLPNLDFLKSMKNLKTFIFDYNVLDGDLTLCRNLQYVYCDRCRKHYNLKDKDLPKGDYVCGNEDIEEWRRLD